MGKIISSLKSAFARLLKVLMVLVILPLAIGLVVGVLEQLDLISLSGFSIRQWILWGFFTYIGCHLILFRPEGLFRISHRLFATLAAWFFGGQVGTTTPSASDKTKGKEGSSSSTVKGSASAQGSTLVAFSPYVVPFYTILLCVTGWALRRWGNGFVFEEVLAFFVGLTLAFHWLMTADDLQEQRSRWHLETYLLAVELVFILTLLIAAACLPMAFLGFSFTQALAKGCSHTQSLFTTAFQQLFF